MAERSSRYPRPSPKNKADPPDNKRYPSLSYAGSTYIEVYAIQACSCREVEGLVIIIAPGQIVGMHGTDNGAQVLAFR